MYKKIIFEVRGPPGNFPVPRLATPPLRHCNRIRRANNGAELLNSEYCIPLPKYPLEDQITLVM